MERKLKSNVIKSDSLLLLTAFIWGTAFVAQRAGMEHVGPFIYNAIRFLLGSLILLPLLLRKNHTSRVTAPDSRSTMLGGALAGLFLFAGASLQQVGIVHTTAGKAGFITGLYVVLVPIMGLAWGHVPKLLSWIGAVLAAAGLYLLSITGGMSISLGDSLVLLGAFCWAAHVHVVGHFSPRVDSLKLALTQFLICSLLSFMTAFAIETNSVAGIMDAALPILYGGILSVGVAYTLQVVAQKDAPPTHAAIILSLETVFAALGGFVVLGETLGLRAILGCGLMLGGMLISQSNFKKS